MIHVRTRRIEASTLHGESLHSNALHAGNWKGGHFRFNIPSTLLSSFRDLTWSFTVKNYGPSPGWGEGGGRCFPHRLFGPVPLGPAPEGIGFRPSLQFAQAGRPCRPPVRVPKGVCGLLSTRQWVWRMLEWRKWWKGEWEIRNFQRISPSWERMTAQPV